MAKKILFILATQYDNMGDLLINKCLVDELANYGEVYIDSKNASKEFVNILIDNPKVHQLSDISTISLKGKGLLLLPFLKNFRFTHLFKSPGPFGGASSLSEALRYLIFYYIFAVMKSRQCLSFLVGVDLIVKSLFDSKLQKLYASVLKGIYVRSIANRDLLQGIDILNAKYFPDLCFLMREKVILSDNRSKVGISFRDLKNDELNKVIFESVRTYSEFFIEKGFDVVVFYQVERDREFNKRLYDSINGEHSDKVLFNEKCLHWNDRDFYNEFLSLISNRLHVLLLSQIYEAIPIAITDGNAKTSKIDNIYSSIGLDKLVFHSSLTFETLNKTFNESSLLVEEIKKVNYFQYNLAKDSMSEIFTN
ncbi:MULTISPECIES: hypothetical protein [Olivibacter]|uniref:Polysaccharide pyruvyl transferase domain-containing protein n=1 Tax=Olivibacter jilunii TaxID=985016 RepID=A0ABW6BA67_9SPHI